jgi:3-hydroxyisobutyrate dehydrogenase-like beta-hydroxyacid dehydrogenase
MQKNGEQLSFVGLGQMGQPMAFHVLQAMQKNAEFSVFDQQTERMAPLVAQGARSVDQLAEAARPGGIVFTMVPDDQALLQVALGKGGILKQLGAGGIHVSLSTVSPYTSAKLANLYQQQGSAYLAATVLGRPDVAARAELSMFLAGESAAKKRVRPFLVAISQRIYDLGEQVEAANITKIGYNFLIAATIEAMGEAVGLVEAHGMDRTEFLRMLVESALFQGAVYEGYGRMIGARDFSEAYFPVALGLKDIQLVFKAADRVGVELPYASTLLEHLQDAQAAGRGNEDWSVLSEFALSKADRLRSMRRK